MIGRKMSREPCPTPPGALLQFQESRIRKCRNSFLKIKCLNEKKVLLSKAKEKLLSQRNEKISNIYK